MLGTLGQFEMQQKNLFFNVDTFKCSLDGQETRQGTDVMTRVTLQRYPRCRTASTNSVIVIGIGSI